MRQTSLASASVLALPIAVFPGQRGGGWEIRTPEGLPPTRFPTMLTRVHRCPPPSATCADRDGWASADAREPRRMRPHLRPRAKPRGRGADEGSFAGIVARSD